MGKKFDKSIPRATPESLGLPYGGADSHAHLNSPALCERLPEVLQRAKASGLAHIGHVFLSFDEYNTFRTPFDSFSELFFIMGFHPSELPQDKDVSIEKLRQTVQNDKKIKAIGETGFDLYWKTHPIVEQEDMFRKHLALAKELDLPVVIHSRDAAKESIRVLEAEGFIGRPVLWHCFSGDAIEHIDRIIANNWHISIPGPVTFPANGVLREVVRLVPQERLLVETDAPYMAPEPWRGHKNEPAFVAFTASEVAKARGADPAELWLALGANTQRFFKLSVADV